MAAVSNLKNMVLNLTLVCLICSGLLGGVYVLTADRIARAQQERTNASIARVLPAFEGQPELVQCEVDGVGYDCFRVEGSGLAVVSTVEGFGGPLTIMVGFDEAGSVVNTVVLSHSETPGLGAKCTSDVRFIDQFKGWDPAVRRLAVVKDGGEVDAITASTITSRAYTAAVQNAYKVYLNLRGNE